MLRLEQIAPAAVDWERMDGGPDRLVFHSRAWIDFLSATFGAKPVVAALRDGGSTVGWFTGLTVRRLGIPILGSPFAPWATQYMGFNLTGDVPRGDALRALPAFAFHELGCRYFEVRDRFSTDDDAHGLGLEYTYNASARFGKERRFTSYVVNLHLDEDTLFKRMTYAARKAVRKAAREGVVVEAVAHDEAGFAEEFHVQLTDVFAKQALVPPFGLDRVKRLLDIVGPSGHLLLLRAKHPTGRSIGTAIYLVDQRRLFFWGSASWRSDQILRPNEALFWHAVQWGRKRGLEELDLGGGATYKRKYGPDELAVPVFRASRPPFITKFRDVAGDALQLRRVLEGGARDRVARHLKRRTSDDAGAT